MTFLINHIWETVSTLVAVLAIVVKLPFLGTKLSKAAIEVIGYLSPERLEAIKLALTKDFIDDPIEHVQTEAAKDKVEVALDVAAELVAYWKKNK